MTIYRDSKKCLRDWLISSDDAANAIHVTAHTFQALVDEGFIRPAKRKGFFRIGHLLYGYAEAVRTGRVSPPNARGTNADVSERQISERVGRASAASPKAPEKDNCQLPLVE